MSRKYAWMMIFVLLGTLFGSNVCAEEIGINLDGSRLNFDVKPMMVNDRLLVPVGVIFGALGANMRWDQNTSTVVASKGDTMVTLTVNSQVAYINGEAVELEAAPTIISGRIMVPLHFVARAMKCYIHWDPDLSVVTILSTRQAVSSEVKNAVKSIVRIVVFDDRGQPVNLGTGFAIGTGEPVKFIITNYHSIAANMYGICVVESEDNLVPADAYQVLPNSDIAVLQIRSPLYGIPPLTLSNQDRVSQGLNVYTIGYGNTDLSNWKQSSPEDVEINAGVIKEKTTWSGTNVYRIDAPIKSGNTGGPLLNELGLVIGVNSVNMLNDNINGASYIDYLRDVLDNRGIPYKGV